MQKKEDKKLAVETCMRVWVETLMETKARHVAYVIATIIILDHALFPLIFVAMEMTAN